MRCVLVVVADYILTVAASCLLFLLTDCRYALLLVVVVVVVADCYYSLHHACCCCWLLLFAASFIMLVVAVDCHLSLSLTTDCARSAMRCQRIMHQLLLLTVLPLYILPAAFNLSIISYLLLRFINSGRSSLQGWELETDYFRRGADELAHIGRGIEERTCVYVLSRRRMCSYSIIIAFHFNWISSHSRDFFYYLISVPKLNRLLISVRSTYWIQIN